VQQSIPSLHSPEKEEAPVAAPGIATEEDIEDSDEAPPASFSPFEPKKTIEAEKKPRGSRYEVPAEEDEDEEIEEMLDDYDVVLDLEPQVAESKPKSVHPPKTEMEKPP